MRALGQRRQIHFYAASLLPGKTICSNWSFCVRGPLLELLLGRTRHHEDLTSRLKLSQVVSGEMKARGWHARFDCTFVALISQTGRFHRSQLDPHHIPTALGGISPDACHFLLLPPWTPSQKVAPIRLLLAWEHFCRYSVSCWMASGCKRATVGMISGCSYRVPTEWSAPAASRTAQVQELGATPSKKVRLLRTPTRRHVDNRPTCQTRWITHLFLSTPLSDSIICSSLFLRLKYTLVNFWTTRLKMQCIVG